MISFKELWTEIRAAFSARNLLLPILILLASACVGTCLLWGVYLLPVDRMERHMESSAEVFAQEGSYPLVRVWWSTSLLDNITDSIMLMEAVDGSDMPPLEKAMLAPRGRFSPEEEAPGGRAYKMLEPVGRYILGIDLPVTETYPRYWHGYLLYIKPLLALTNYRNMRLLNGLVQTVLLALLCWRFDRVKRRDLIPPYLLMVLLLMPLSLAKSFQFSSCYYIMLFASFACLSLRKNREGLTMLFLYVGIATAYFDFLTYPAATFGVPAVLTLSLLRGETPERKLSLLFRAGVHWCFGYLGMWAMKWLIGGAVTGENVVADAWQTVLLRMSHTLADETALRFSAAGCILRVMRGFFVSPFVVPFLLYCGVMAFLAVKRGRTGAKEAWKILAPYLLVGLLPFGWFSLTVNHSYIHSYFTCRALCVSALALMCALAELCSVSDRIS